MRTRIVGPESRRTYLQKLDNGFFTKYMGGACGLDIGFQGHKGPVEPILPSATGVDLGYPGYDGLTLPFTDNSQDYIYSSHCLEHITQYIHVLRDWHRVIKVTGYIVIVVPHAHLYEKKASPPSDFNRGHRRFYTPASLLSEVEEALPPNSYRVRFLEDGDDKFDYSRGPGLHSNGQYEITLVLQKIPLPTWSLA